MTSPKITVFIPTLNEAVGLEEFLPRIKKQGCDQILISDGNSRDGSEEIAARHGAEFYVQKRRGIRHAYIEAWPLIRGDIVITMSPDGNCIPEDMPRLIAELGKGYDMVVASRYFGEASSEDDDMVTGFGNWLFTRTVNVLFGANYTDAMGIYRGYRTALFYELGLDKEVAYSLPERLFGTVIGIEPLLSVRSVSHAYKVGEIGSNEPKRLGGERKLQVLRWGAAYYFQFLHEFVKGKPRRDRTSVSKQPPA
ncbi:MAG: glycosyltransferase family 2 protein [Terrimicrobiaceae bacterium]